jgi:AraC family transcriptional regulator of adaptative response/methylated-DNA-[protein]-cysteine methyltransferase
MSSPYPSRLPPAAEMEAAYQRRDASYDGVFYLGVRTTGIFCRPSCPARKPLARNVEYFGSVKDALFAGYRPCKRCRPLEVPGGRFTPLRGGAACGVPFNSCARASASTR